VIQVAQNVLTELRSLIADLGKDGGIISPSVYDTAQVLRYCPAVDSRAVVDWLLGQQQADGGWGDPLIPIARPVPTLATLLALQRYRGEKRVRQTVEAGERWLELAGAEWPAEVPADIPVGNELLLPTLLVDAALVGLRVSAKPYAALIALGERRRQLIAKLAPRPGTPAAHSWEAWGTLPDRRLMDTIGSIGHSPAATAAWLHAARGRDDLRAERGMAEGYLAQAATATGTGISGVVPTVWPIDRFEQTGGLYALLLAGLLRHCQLRSVIEPQVAALNRAFQTNGIGFSDWFVPDGDDTTMALAVVRAGDQPRTLASLQHFAVGDHWCTYHGEMHPSASVVAHALHVLDIFGETGHTAAEVYLAGQQSSDGRWRDKWNASWLYATSHDLFALQNAACSPATRSASRALLAGQSSGGGWGSQRVSAEETAYALMALDMLALSGYDRQAVDPARERGKRWLISQYQPNKPVLSACWLGKEIYRPHRVARAYELAAVLQSIESAPSLTVNQREAMWIAAAS